MQKTPQNNSDAQTTSQPAAPQFDEMPQRKKSLSVWSLATAFCSATQRLFAIFFALLAEQTVLSAVVHQVVVTLLAHLNAMDCPAHTIPALA